MLSRTEGCEKILSHTEGCEVAHATNTKAMSPRSQFATTTNTDYAIAQYSARGCRFAKTLTSKTDVKHEEFLSKSF